MPHRPQADTAKLKGDFRTLSVFPLLSRKGGQGTTILAKLNEGSAWDRLYLAGNSVRPESKERALYSVALVREFCEHLPHLAELAA